MLLGRTVSAFVVVVHLEAGPEVLPCDVNDVGLDMESIEGLYFENWMGLGCRVMGQGVGSSWGEVE